MPGRGKTYSSRHGLSGSAWRAHPLTPAAAWLDSATAGRGSGPSSQLCRRCRARWSEHFHPEPASPSLDLRGVAVGTLGPSTLSGGRTPRFAAILTVSKPLGFGQAGERHTRCWQIRNLAGAIRGAFWAGRRTPVAPRPCSAPSAGRCRSKRLQRLANWQSGGHWH